MISGGIPDPEYPGGYDMKYSDLSHVWKEIYQAEWESVCRGSKAIAAMITDENGEILFELVYDEGYSFKETKAPQGYEPDDGKHEIVLPEDYSFSKESPIIITITDKKIPEVNTGDGSGLYLWYSLSAVSFGGVLGVLLVRRRKRK